MYKLLFACIFLSVTGVTFGQTKKSPSFIDEEIRIPVPKSELYVRMRGNPGKPLIINLHGGPGGYSGIDIKLMGPGLESHYLMAWLDQRGCGKSPVSSDSTLLNVSQYVEDLNIVVDTLISRYHKTKINLVGTSWGGMYGFLYVLNHQKKVGAYACVDGKANSQYQNSSLIEHELRLIAKKLDQNPSQKERKTLLTMQEDLQRIKSSNFEKFYLDVNRIKHEYPPKLGFNAYFADTSKIISTKSVLADSALLALMKYTPKEYLAIGPKAERVNRAFRNNPDYNNMNIEPELRKVKIPVSVIQGEKDYVVGIKHAQLIYDALTDLPADKKELHIIPNTGHVPAIENPVILNEILNSFFGKHAVD